MQNFQPVRKRTRETELIRAQRTSKGTLLAIIINSLNAKQQVSKSYMDGNICIYSSKEVEDLAQC